MALQSIINNWQSRKKRDNSWPLQVYEEGYIQRPTDNGDVIEDFQPAASSFQRF